MSTFFDIPARQILSPADSTELRTQSAGPLRTGQIAVFSDPLFVAFRRLVIYDETSTAVDAGNDEPAAWKPFDIVHPAPGRWLPFGTSASGVGAEHTYVKRDAAGAITGVAVGGDVAQAVAHVNWAVGANDPAPAVDCGLSVDRGAIAGVERNRPGLWFNEIKPDQWYLATDTNGNDAPATSMYLRALGVRSSTAPTGAGFLQSAVNESWISTIGGTDYFLVRGLAGPLGTFGDDTLATVDLQSSTLTTIRSRLGAVDVRAATTFTVEDATGASTYFSVDIAGAATTSFLETRIQSDNIAAAQTIGLLLTNETASTGGVQEQYSPGAIWRANSWTGAANEIQEALIQLQGVDGRVRLVGQRRAGGAGAWQSFFIFDEQPTEVYAPVNSLFAGGFLAISGNAFMSTMGAGGSGLKFDATTGHPRIISTATTNGVKAEVAIAVGDSDSVFDILANSGTRTAGDFITIGDNAGIVWRVSSATATRGHPTIGGVPQGYHRVVNDTSTTLNVTVGDNGALFTLSNALAVTVNLPAGFAGARYGFKNKGAGIVTITPNGAEKLFTNAQVATFSLATGDACEVAWDGTDWAIL